MSVPQQTAFSTTPFLIGGQACSGHYVSCSPSYEQFNVDNTSFDREALPGGCHAAPDVVPARACQDKVPLSTSQDINDCCISSREKSYFMCDPVLPKKSAAASQPATRAQSPQKGDLTTPELYTTRSTDISDYIPSPQVDPEVIKKQCEIIKNIWPDISVAASHNHPEFAELYADVKSFQVPNFMGARRTLSSGLNLQNWELLLQGYHDAEICYFLHYGWPVGYHSTTQPSSVADNHPSAKLHYQHIDTFIKKELSYKALAGPFREPPFHPWTRQSPLMTRPKKETDSRRVIVDLSFPHGSAVNDGINIKSIYGRDTSYTLPTIGDLTTKVKEIGPTAWVWKADLARAYRQLRVDPLDAPLLGLKFRDDIYIDLCPSFGCRSSSGSCQGTSMAVCYLMAKKGWFILAFLDDFAGVQASEQDALQAYSDFLELAAQLGLSLAKDKCSPPTKRLEWLGYDINISQMTVAIPRDKLNQVLNECIQWSTRTKASRVMVQSITGKLLHLAHCVKGARKFTSRILDKLRHMAATAQEWTTVDSEFLADVRWFQLYASAANGVSLIAPSRHHIYIECDSSLSGGGGNSEAAYYTWKYSKAHRDKFPAIHQLEALNLLVAYRTLCPMAGTQGGCIVMLTDNQASAYALQSGKTKDPVLAACSRELWLDSTRRCTQQSSRRYHQSKVSPTAHSISQST